MKKALVIALLFSFVCSTVFAEEAQKETVVQMTYLVKMPDVIREGKYSGETTNGIPNGFGVFVSANSEGEAWHYLGEWIDGEMSGEGGCYWDGGQSKVGTWEHNDMVCGETHTSPSDNVWVDYRPNDHGCYEAIEYREDGSVILECCVSLKTGEYHKGTFYTKTGDVFFSGEIGEGFNWNLLYIE